MKLKQLSVFLENKPGQLSLPCRALADAGINITTACLADTSEFGILRLIVAEHDRAKVVLEAAGFAVNETEVLAAEVSDQPGGLSHILEALEEQQVNVEYMYAFTLKGHEQALLVFRFSKPEQAAAVLQRKGIPMHNRATLWKS